MTDVTFEEYGLTDSLRELSEYERVDFTASHENGVWEVRLAMTPHPIYEKYKDVTYKEHNNGKKPKQSYRVDAAGPQQVG